MVAPDDWTEAIGAMVSGRVGRVIVLGPTDAGKSSFCRALLREVVRRGRKAALVDADVGQKMVGPPAAVTRHYTGEPCPAAMLTFVGTTDPVRGFASVVRGACMLSATACADLVVVNTSGLLSGPGRALKRAKIAATAPDLIVAIGSHKGLDAILAAHPSVAVARLAPSPLARRKSKAERRRAREDSFRRYFERARAWSIGTARLQDGDWPEQLDGLLVGIADSRGNDLALGVVRGVDVGRKYVDLLAPDVKRDTHAVRPGKLRLDATCREFRI